jgi:hypothetical protein
VVGHDPRDDGELLEHLEGLQLSLFGISIPSFSSLACLAYLEDLVVLEDLACSGSIPILISRNDCDALVDDALDDGDLLQFQIQFLFSVHVSL